MSGPRAMRPVTIVTDLLLILLGFLGGVGLERVLLTPHLADRTAVTVQATVPVASRAAIYPTWGQPRAGTTPSPVLSASAAASTRRASPAAAPVPPVSPRDLRQELQRIARWQRPTEVPAGANHYPAAGTPSAAANRADS